MVFNDTTFRKNDKSSVFVPIEPLNVENIETSVDDIMGENIPSKFFKLPSPVVIFYKESIEPPENITMVFVDDDKTPNELHTKRKSTVIPKIVFIVPHRDREYQRSNFTQRMKYIMEDFSEDDYEIFFVNQCDKRSFNRGAIKNIGFMAMREKYPNNYNTITFVFNDVDTVPIIKNTFDYFTTIGIIKHFYGFNYALGGIFSITGFDFERINGFINLWAWGFEDNYLNNEAVKHNIYIDRSVFYKINDKRIDYYIDDVTRTVNRGEFDFYLSGLVNGISTISSLEYDIDIELGFVNVYNFEVGHHENKILRFEYDLRDGPAPFKSPPVRNKRGSSMKMIF
jgi:hypothetical protein